MLSDNVISDKKCASGQKPRCDQSIIASRCGFDIGDNIDNSL